MVISILPTAPMPAAGPIRLIAPTPAVAARTAPPPMMPKALTERKCISYKVLLNSESSPPGQLLLH